MSDSAFDPHGLRIRDVGAGEFDENSGVDDEPLLPHLSEFLKDIRLRLGAADEALGRQYQREVVNAGALEIISPLSGRRTSATESILVLGKNFYRFCESREFYVAAARVKFGYPLLALFVPDANVLVKWEIENSKRGIEPKHVAALRTIVEEQGRRPVARSSAEPVTIVMGHKNFAHHLWNELPALERLLAGLATNRTPRLLAMREPLGPIERLFPEVAGWKIERLRGRSPSVANGNGKLFVNLGSYCVTSSIRDRILSHAKTSASARARKLDEQLRTSSAPVFWVSVRMQSPTLTNQREALTELGSRILQYFPACTVLFDGFSLPEDWDQCEDDDVRFYRAAAHESRKEIDAIIADITGNRRRSMSQFVNLGGWGILDCIATAALATCYFCHVGTVQHKIGWTTNVPGMIHANRRVISGKSAVWHAPSRLQNGVMPETIPPRMVTGAGKEEDYKILDTIGVAKTVCNFFQQCASAKFRA